MILGVFMGRTVSAVARRVEKHTKEQLAIRTTIEQAMADRSAAIAELRNEMMEFEKFRQQV